MTTDPFILDMLGETLRDAVTEAQTRLSDTTVMARIAGGLVSIERGSPAVVIDSGIAIDDAVAALAALT